MDAEHREAYARIDDKLDRMLEAQAAHSLGIQQVANEARRANERLDKHEEMHKSARGWWAGLLLASASAIVLSWWDWLKKKVGG